MKHGVFITQFLECLDKIYALIAVHIPYFENFSTENISLIIKFKVNYFRGYITSSKYFYLEHVVETMTCTVHMRTQDK